MDEIKEVPKYMKKYKEETGRKENKNVSDEKLNPIV